MSPLSIQHVQLKGKVHYMDKYIPHYLLTPHYLINMFLFNVPFQICFPPFLLK